MDIRRISRGKRDFLPLLLLGDEQEEMIGRYLERGELFALYDGGELRTVAVITDEGGGVCELKNLATWPKDQGRGYATALLEFLCKRCASRFHTMQLGTGDSPRTVPFYQKRGFVYSHRIPNFFTDHYDHPIFEDGVRLADMVYFKRNLEMEVCL